MRTAVSGRGCMGDGRWDRDEVRVRIVRGGQTEDVRKQDSVLKLLLCTPLLPGLV